MGYISYSDNTQPGSGSLSDRAAHNIDAETSATAVQANQHPGALFAPVWELSHLGTPDQSLSPVPNPLPCPMNGADCCRSFSLPIISEFGGGGLVKKSRRGTFLNIHCASGIVWCVSSYVISS